VCLDKRDTHSPLIADSDCIFYILTGP